MRDRAILLILLIAAAAGSALLVRSGPRRELPPAALDPGVVEPPAAPSVAITAATPTAAVSVFTPPPPPPAYVRLNPSGADACPEGMVLVDGVYCPFVGHRCARYESEAEDICQNYAPEVMCEGRLQHRRFCIDIYEYPNLLGVRPAMRVSFDEARRACALEGKRLCSIEEWEFACEGTQMWPYPYGMERDKGACNIDHAREVPEASALADPHRISEVIERADGRVASGEMHRCVSPFGARDMTGNVAEWVDNPVGTLDNKPLTAAVKGGAWSRGRARCRPIALPPSALVDAYQVGFRCCDDAKGSERPVSAAPPNARIPRKSVMVKPAP